jgi:hypothetical protein
MRRVDSQNTIIAIIATLSAAVALAEDFKTVSGKEYKDATVSRVEPDGIVLKSKSGISKVYVAELPTETSATLSLRRCEGQRVLCRTNCGGNKRVKLCEASRNI